MATRMPSLPPKCLISCDSLVSAWRAMAAVVVPSNPPLEKSSFAAANTRARVGSCLPNTGEFMAPRLDQLTQFEQVSFPLSEALLYLLVLPQLLRVAI